MKNPFPGTLSCLKQPLTKYSLLSDWKERFTVMMDAVSMEANKTILLGDLDIDLLRQNAPWTNIINMYHLRQVISTPTLVTASSESLIDHIYVSDVHNVIEHCVPASACSYHYPVCLTWSHKGAKVSTAGHKVTTYRSFANFDENRFIHDLIASSLSMVYSQKARRTHRAPPPPSPQEPSSMVPKCTLGCPKHNLTCFLDSHWDALEL